AAAAAALMWLVGLWIGGVPSAPLWALLRGVFQFVPQIGMVLGLIGPALAIFVIQGGWMMFLKLIILYVIIAVVDGFFLQPYFMRRTARVPLWASIPAPIILGILIPFWGVILAPPLLAIIFAYREKLRKAAEQAVLETGKPPTATL